MTTLVQDDEVVLFPRSPSVGMLRALGCKADLKYMPTSPEAGVYKSLVTAAESSSTVTSYKAERKYLLDTIEDVIIFYGMGWDDGLPEKMERLKTAYESVKVLHGR